MDDIRRALIDAWKNVRPRLARDDDELRRRLLRRRQALLQTPPRAWCLAIRAADTRLTDETRVRVDPRRSLLPLSIHHSAFSIARTPSPSTPPTCKPSCAPVELLSPGEPLKIVAEKLGTTPHGLLNARLNKRFHTHHVGALDGHWGKPHPMLYAPGELDPSARGWPAPDPLFSIIAKLIGSRIPKTSAPRSSHPDLPGRHARIPRQRKSPPRASRRRQNVRHPAAQAQPETPAPRARLRPYKWKGDEFVGYDWRAAETNPLIKENYERHQRRNQLARASTKRRRRENPPRAAPAAV
jgi:hypothetical protein